MRIVMVDSGTGETLQEDVPNTKPGLATAEYIVAYLRSHWVSAGDHDGEDRLSKEPTWRIDAYSVTGSVTGFLITEHPRDENDWFGPVVWAGHAYHYITR